MKTRKLLSLVLAMIMLLGCMTVTAFAGVGLDEITLDQTAVTLVVGGTKTLKPTVKFQGDDVTEMHSEYIEWSSTAETVATVDKGVVTAVKEGTTTITASRGDFSATCTVTVISGTAALDLDTNTKKEIDQNYTFTQASEEYTDVTKVKLDWTINDIAATFKSHKTWDPDTLTWVEAKEDIAVTNEGASFTLTNYSSVAVKATASFAVETSLAATFTEATFTNNECTVKTPVVQDTTTTYQDSDFTALKQTITATLTLKKDAFADLTATTSATKYGTYTVTISAAPTVKLTSLTESIGGSTVYYYPVLGGTNPQPDKFYYSTDGVTFTEIPKSGDTYTMADVAEYANAGQLFYSGGSLNTVRTVPNISWNDVFKDNSGGLYPYYASTVYDDLQDVIKTKIASDGTEIVEKVIAFNENDYSYEVLTINGVELIDIYDAYYTSVLTVNSFYGICGGMLSHIAVESDGESLEMRMLEFFAPDELELGDPKYRNQNAIDDSDFCALISRTFN